MGAPLAPPAVEGAREGPVEGLLVPLGLMDCISITTVYSQTQASLCCVGRCPEVTAVSIRDSCGM